MTGKTFTATVTTVIYHHDQLEFHDRMVFDHVSAEFIAFLTGSCRTTLNKLLRFETNTAPNAWTLHYQTRVVDSDGAIVSNRPMISFPAMSKEQIYKFLTIALAELTEANYLRYSDFSDDKPVLVKQWWPWKLLNMLMRRGNAPVV